jgi:hypothetical protein
MGHSVKGFKEDVYPQALTLAVYPRICGHVSTWLGLHMHVVVDTHPKSGDLLWPVRRICLCMMSLIMRYGPVRRIIDQN